MVLEKRDTTGGFDPALPTGPEVVVPSRKALRMDGVLERSTLSPAIHQLLLNMARVRNVVSSLRLENIDVDLEEARRVVQRRESLDPRDRAVLRFANTYGWINETPTSELPEPSIDLMLQLHADLFHDDDEIPREAVGRLKRRENAIIDKTSGLETFVPTPPERTEAELGALFAWYRRAKDTHLPGIVAAIFFAELQAIHPFRDGNGRLGRVLNALVLKKLGHESIALVPLDGRFYATHDRYYDALASTNDGRTWHVWSRYFTGQLRRAYELALRRADLQPLLDRQRSQVTRAVLDWVLSGGGGRFKRGDFPNPDGFSGSAITGALADLVDQGVLEPEGEKRGRTYRLATKFLEEVYGRLDLEDG